MKNYWSFVLLWILLTSYNGFAQNDSVIFSARGGFYEDTFVLRLFNYYPQNHIRYTINGNRPTAQSTLYSDSLLLDECLYSKSDIYTIVNCPEDDFFLPDSVRHCIVIRAAVFDENDSCVSMVKTNSYFIRALGCDTHGLPAVSICADSLDLFDYERGILVPGIHYDPLNPNWTGNYYQTGREWERCINIEFYELDNRGINQQAGLRTHGGNGRRFQQKCLNIYARKEYGKKRFKHEFFETIPNNNFKHLALKSFVSSWNQSGVNDYICNQIASQLDIETLASRPVLLYLNGEYWGIYYIQERPDERYLEDHFGIDIDRVNIVSGWEPNVVNGTDEHFLELFHWMEMADLSDPEAYAYAKTQIDVDNFIDYQIFELFSENRDWPANNMRCWQLDDGKWRWIFYDGDACLLWMTFYAFDYAVYEGYECWPSNWKVTLFFRRLMENQEFQNLFNARFNELLTTTFDYSNTRPILENAQMTLESEIPFQSNRFGVPWSVEKWNVDMGRNDWFLFKRAECILDPLHGLVYDLPEELLTAFQCYPNPFSEEIHLSVDTEAFGEVEISIYDMMFRKVFAMPYQLDNGTNTITLHPNLPAGVYVLKVGHSAYKIVRQ